MQLDGEDIAHIRDILRHREHIVALPRFEDRVHRAEASIGAMTSRIDGIAVSAVHAKELASLQREHLDEKFATLTADIHRMKRGVTKLLWTIGSAVIVVVVGFALRGGGLG